MKKCAVCDREYEDNYDACPHCAKSPAPAAKPKSAFGALGALVLALFGLCVVVSMCSGGGAKDDPALASAAKSAVAPVLSSLAGPLGRDPIRSVSADSAGAVIVKLNFTKEFYTGGSGVGQAGLSDLAASIATPIFDSAPQAQQVSVMDADGAMLDSFKRSDRK